MHRTPSKEHLHVHTTTPGVLYGREKIVKRTMSDTTLLQQSCSTVPVRPALQGHPPDPPLRTHSAPVSLTMPGHLSHCFLMLPARLRFGLAGVPVGEGWGGLGLGGCKGIGFWFKRGRWLYAERQGGELWLSQFPVSCGWGFFSFCFESSACQGAKPICLSSKTPPPISRSLSLPLRLSLFVSHTCSHLFSLCLGLGHVDSYQ